MWVRVYKNLNQECLSVQNTKGKVVDHVQPPVYLKDAEFRVQPAGRQRVLEEEVKNVHAKVHGERLDEAPDIELEEAVRYNPYKFESFVFADTKEPIYRASVARVDMNRVYVPETAKEMPQKPSML